MCESDLRPRRPHGDLDLLLLRRRRANLKRVGEYQRAAPKQRASPKWAAGAKSIVQAVVNAGPRRPPTCPGNRTSRQADKCHCLIYWNKHLLFAHLFVAPCPNLDHLRPDRGCACGEEAASEIGSGAEMSIQKLARRPWWLRPSEQVVVNCCCSSHLLNKVSLSLSFARPRTAAAGQTKRKHNSLRQ